VTSPLPTPASASNVDLLLAIVRLETKLDNLTSQVTPQISDHETRIRSLERARWPLASIGTLSGIGALVVTYLK
jgi:hypothetical protein